MKQLIIITLIGALTACSTNRTEQIKAKLAKLKEQTINIESEIKTLEKELAELEKGANVKGLVPVLVKEIKPGRFEHFITVNGNVELYEEARISPETGGQIKRIHVSKGDRVKKGQMLVSLNTSVLENGIKELKTGLELANKIYEKQKSLWEQNIGSEIQYLEAKNAKESLERKLETLNAQLEMSLIKAPFDGIVDEVYSKEGELGAPGQPMLHLVNLSNLKIVADLSESFLPKLKLGDMVRITFPAYTNEVFEAPIRRIGNVVDSRSRTITIELSLTNRGELIKPNQIAILNIMDFESPNALVVPSIVVKQDSRGEFLFIAENNLSGENIARKVYVKTGMAYQDNTMVSEGLTPGQRVIVSGYNLVGNGSLVEIR